MVPAQGRESPGFYILLALAFTALVVGICVTGYRDYRSQSEILEADAGSQLSTVADLKVQQIVDWRRERIGDAVTIAGNPALSVRCPHNGADRPALPRWLVGGSALCGPATTGEDERMRAWLNGYRRFYGYREIVLLDRQGVSRLTASGGPFDDDDAVTLAREALRTGHAVVSDLHRHGPGPVYIDVVAPLAAGNGAVLLTIEASRFLYPVIQSWPVPSRTAECLLVEAQDNEVVFLNELRWRKGTALTLRVPRKQDLPAALAVAGATGIRAGVDYRGIPVAAALRQVPETPWALVAKIDEDEVYAPLPQRLWGVAIALALRLAFIAAAFGLLWRLQRGRYQRQQLAAAVERKSIEARLAHLRGCVNDIVLVADETGRIVEANDRATESYGYTQEELLQMTVRDLRDESEQAALNEVWATLLKQGWAVSEARHRRKDGSPMLVESSARIVELNGRHFCQSILRDVTERRRAEGELRRVTRALRVLSACNQAVIRSGGEESLYREVCDAITSVGAYPLAWIAAPEDNEEKSVRVVEAAGRGRAYLDSVAITWADEPRGRGPVGTCLRAGEIAVCSDAERDPAFEPWRIAAERFGFKSLISLPLLCDGIVFGALNIYTPEPDAFHDEERRLLEELADDVSYGVETRRRLLEKQRAEAALQRSESEFKTLFDNVSDAVFIIDAECRFREVNRIACERLGYSRDELVRMGIADIDGSEYAKLTPEGLATLLKSGQALLETIHRRRDGSRFPVEINARRFEYQGAPMVLSVARDISERKGAEAEAAKRTAELERARTEAENASRAKSEFLAHMSHEIRTPLNGVIGMIGLLLDTELAAEQRDFAETVHSSAQALLALVNDLLDVSRIEAGRMETEPARFDLVDCLRDISELMWPQAHGKGLEYTVDSEMACRAVVGDAGRLRQIVLNLLSNAMKFTERGYVKLVVRGDEPVNDRAEFRIAVEDSGPGIPADKVPKLFRSFSQVDSSLARKHEGAGLGLAISRRLAELMGGTLTVRTEEGRGSTFLLSLPLTTAGEEAPAAGLQQFGPGLRALTVPGLRILMAEDNPVNQRLGLRLLEKLGCRVDVAANGNEAVEMTRRCGYDLILMDCRMPEMDGFAATRKIRSREGGGSHVPIVAMTAHAIVGAREECLGAGMDDYITKPVSPQELERVLQKWGNRAAAGDRKNQNGLRELTHPDLL